MIICRTPFRISFFGGGTDFKDWYTHNGGSTISTTIDKYCYINVRKLPNFFKYNYRLRYFKTEEVKRVDQIKHPSFREIIKYTKLTNQNLEIIHSADLPALSGMGASSSSTVCLLQALNTLKEKIITKKKLALDALKIEQEVLKEMVGSQDQISASFGGMNYIKFNQNDTFEVMPIINKNNITKIEKNLLLVFTGLQRKAQSVEKQKIKNLSKNYNYLSRMNEITQEAMKLFNGNLNLKYFGELLDEQWTLKKKLSSKVSNKLIDEIYDVGKKSGAYGAKLLGAGNGGFILFICNDKTKKTLNKKLKNFLKIPIRFDTTGSQIVYFSNIK